jgi:hypothetical protein
MGGLERSSARYLCERSEQEGRVSWGRSACASERRDLRAWGQPPTTRGTETASAAEEHLSFARAARATEQHGQPSRPQGGFGGSPPDDPLACLLLPQNGSFNTDGIFGLSFLRSLRSHVLGQVRVLERRRLSRSKEITHHVRVHRPVLRLRDEGGREHVAERNPQRVESVPAELAPPQHRQLQDLRARRARAESEASKSEASKSVAGRERRVRRERSERNEGLPFSGGSGLKRAAERTSKAGAKEARPSEVEAGSSA